MQLDRLLSHITYESVQGSQRREITDICYHSGKVENGSLFVCLKGFSVDGHDYLPDALRRGAAAVVLEAQSLVFAGGDGILYTEHSCIRVSEILRDFGASVLVVRDGRTALAELSAAFFDYPAKKLRMVGITGTKGKTTTAFLTVAILQEAGYHPGWIGTVSVYNGREEIPSLHTTPEAYDLQMYLHEMVENGCDCCVMEVSSQGIKLQRVTGIWYEIGVFLNIEPDHIGKGEHASFAEYLYCKSRLLSQCFTGIVNRDDTHFERVIAGRMGAVETFSVRYPSNRMADDIAFFMERGRLSCRFTVTDGTGRRTYSMQLPGLFNVYNALAAIAIVSHFKVDPWAVKRGLATAEIPEGVKM